MILGTSIRERRGHLFDPFGGRCSEALPRRAARRMSIQAHLALFTSIIATKDRIENPIYILRLIS